MRPDARLSAFPMPRADRPGASPWEVGDRARRQQTVFKLDRSRGERDGTAAYPRPGEPLDARGLDRLEGPYLRAHRGALRNGMLFALVLAGLAAPSWGQVHQTTTPLSDPAATALTYFQQVDGHRFDRFLQRLRPARITPDAKERVLKMLPQVDVISASGGQRPSSSPSGQFSGTTSGSQPST